MLAMINPLRKQLNSYVHLVSVIALPFLILVAGCGKKGCTEGNPEVVYPVKNSHRLLSVGVRETVSYTYDRDSRGEETGMRTVTYSFDGFSFNLLDGATGRLLHTICWDRSGSEKEHNKPENYTTFLTDSNELFILFHPVSAFIAEKDLLPPHAYRFRIAGDSIVSLPDFDLQGMKIEPEYPGQRYKNNYRYVRLKNEYNESHYLSFASGSIIRKAPEIKREGAGKVIPERMYSVFFFCPKETGSTRGEAYFLRYKPAKYSSSFSYLSDYKPPTPGAVVKDKYLNKVSRTSSQSKTYWPSEETEFSLPGIEQEVAKVRKPEVLQKIMHPGGSEKMFVEPNVLHRTDSTLFFIAKDNGLRKCYYANTSQVLWSAEVREEAKGTEEPITDSDLRLISNTADRIVFMARGHWVVCLDLKTGKRIWEYPRE